MIDIIVFLGPTLAIKEAQKILPNACYLPPARCGDVLRVTRLNPQVIAIIDGNFESSAAIWHKEILFALEKGITVLGASSMGALRARELKSFGMIGVGQIVEDYFRSLNEDDAVAILHGARGSEFSPKTEAYINIKASIREALLQNIIDAGTATMIDHAAKALFYPYRTLELILQKISKTAINPKVIEDFREWIVSNGWIDIKKRDAISLLKKITENSFSFNKGQNFKLQRSIFFRTHYKQVMCSPFTYDQIELPIQEKVAFQSRYLGTIYRQTRRLAYLLSACYAIAKKSPAECVNISESNLTLPENFLSPSWRVANNCDIQQQLKILHRYTRIKKCFDFNLQHSTTKEIQTDYLLGLMRLSLTNEYKTYRKQTKNQQDLLKLFQQNEPLKYRTFSWVASLWWLVEQYAARLSLIPNIQFVQNYSNKFRAKHKLFSTNAIKQWVIENDLTNDEYTHLMMVSARMNYLVLQNNLDALGVIDTEENVWWFLDALYLSEVYSEAKKMMQKPTFLIGYNK